MTTTAEKIPVAVRLIGGLTAMIDCAHVTERVRDLRAAFGRHGLIDRLQILTPEKTATL